MWSLIINQIGGERMRSSLSGKKKQEEGLHQTHRCTYPLTDTLVKKTFLAGDFTRQLLLWWRTSMIQSRYGIGWRRERERRARGKFFVYTEGRPDTKVIRLMHNIRCKKSLLCHKVIIRRQAMTSSKCFVRVITLKHYLLFHTEPVCV